MRACTCFLVGVVVHVVAFLATFVVTQQSQIPSNRTNTASMENVEEAEHELLRAYALLDSTPCSRLLPARGEVSRAVTLWPIEFASGLLPEVSDARLSASQSHMTLVAVAPLRGRRIFLAPVFFRCRQLWAPTLAHELLHSVYGWEDQKLKRLLCPTDLTEATHCITIEILKGCPTMQFIPNAVDSVGPSSTEQLERHLPSVERIRAASRP